MSSAAQSKASQEPTVKRIHVGGLTNPLITHADLQKRFSSFGVVQKVDGVGKDAFGEPRTFAFLTMSTTPAQISRCISLLSGSTWKGSTLKIGEAKPLYSDRLAEERAAMKRPAAEDEKVEGGEEAVVGEWDGQQKKKKVKLGRGVKGVEAKSMEPIGIDSAKGRKNWHITPLQHLIRPIILRPTHPIPAPILPLPTAKPSSSSAVKPATKPAAAPKKKKTGKGGAKMHPPPSRSRRIVIDPRRYERSHLGENMLDSGVDAVGTAGVWVCEDVEGDEDIVRWRREGSGAEEGKEEVVLLGRKRNEEVLRILAGLRGSEVPAPSYRSGGVGVDGQIEASDDDEAEDDWVPLGVEAAADVSLFNDDEELPLPMDDSDQENDGEPSPLFVQPSLPPVPTPSNSIPSAPPPKSKPSNLPPTKPLTVEATPSSSSSKPKPTPASAKPPPKSKATPSAPAVPAQDDPFAAEILAERSRGLDVLSSLFGGDDANPSMAFSPPSSPGPTAAEPNYLLDSDDDADVYEMKGRPLAPNAPVVPFKPAGKMGADVKETRKVVFEGLPDQDVEDEGDVVMDAAPEQEKEEEGEVPAEVEEIEPEAEEVVEEEEELDPVALALKELMSWSNDAEEEEAAPEEQDAMRLRGGSAIGLVVEGMGSDSEDEGDEESSSESDSSSSSSGSDSDQEEEKEEKRSEVVESKAMEEKEAVEEDLPPSKKVKISSLKSMFAPKDDGPSFSLFSSLPMELDLDLDPTADPTLSAALPSLPEPSSSSFSYSTQHQPPSHSSAPQPAAAAAGPSGLTSLFRQDASIPYFFPFLHLPPAERAKGPKQQAQSLLEIEAAKPLSAQPPVQPLSGFAGPPGGGLGASSVTAGQGAAGVGGFWRQETDEEMRTYWEENHLDLTREFKRRHREAVKRRKRRGGGVEGEDLDA